MSIFDNKPRSDEGSPQHGEPSFDYLDRSARPEAGRVRDLVDAWLQHYPARHRDSLVTRLRSPLDNAHKGAFFELFTHQIMRANGLSVVAVEPALRHTTRTPDFLVESRWGNRFYLEATYSTGLSKEETAAEARLNSALEAVDTVHSPLHLLDLHVRGKPTAPVSINRLRGSIGRWLSALPATEESRARPFVYEEHGMRLMLTAWPRHNCERVGRSIGVRHFPMRAVTVDEDVRTKLIKKARRYGPLDHPYLIAISTSQRFHGKDDTFDALFGLPQTVTHHLMNGRRATRDERAGDGVWGSASAPHKRGLSAVLTIEGVCPWNFANRHATLIRNPWAERPLAPLPLGVGEINPVDGRFQRIDGRPMHEIFGLPAGWPET